MTVFKSLILVLVMLGYFLWELPSERPLGSPKEFKEIEV